MERKTNNLWISKGRKQNNRTTINNQHPSAMLVLLKAWKNTNKQSTWQHLAAVISHCCSVISCSVISCCCCHLSLLLCGYKWQVTIWILLSLFVALPLYCTDACSIIHEMEENWNKMMGGQTTTCWIIHCQYLSSTIRIWQLNCW